MRQHEFVPVYGGLYFQQRDAETFCHNMNTTAGVPDCPTGALSLEGPYVVKALSHLNTVLVWIVTKED